MKDIKIREEIFQDIEAIRAIEVTFFQITLRSSLLENEGASGHPNDVS